MIQAVIFDMDGLLIDSEPFWHHAHKSTLASMGHFVNDEDVKAHAGLRTLDEVKLWRQRFGFIAPSDEELTIQIEQKVIDLVLTQGKKMAGVERLIVELDTHDIPMAVASSSAMNLIEAVLEKLQIRHFMCAIHSGHDEKRGKPFPDVFNSAAKALGVKPNNCLVFEDSLNGVKAAKSAGMKCIAIPAAGYDESAFAAAQPDRIFNSLEDVRWKIVKDL